MPPWWRISTPARPPMRTRWREGSIRCPCQARRLRTGPRLRTPHRPGLANRHRRRWPCEMDADALTYRFEELPACLDPQPDTEAGSLDGWAEIEFRAPDDWHVTAVRLDGR